MVSRLHTFARITLFLLLGIPCLHAQTLVGTLSTDVTVDAHGSANCTVPINAPPGRGGLQPQVSLNYNSGGGDGPVGIGFSVSTGFPHSITRGRSLLARDGTVQGVAFDATDKLYLDGKRLLLVSGTECLPGSTYRTEVDSFVTVVASGVGSNIETFVVTDKNGVKMTFGKYNGSVDGYQCGVIAAGGIDTVAYEFALKHVEDTVSNYINFNYYNGNDGEYQISEILYTGNLNASIPTYGKIQFSYSNQYNSSATVLQSRSNSITRYVAKRKFQSNAILNRVSTFVGYSSTDLATQYDLVYEQGPNFGPLRLTSVTGSFRSESSGTSLQSVPATTFTWDDANPSYSAIQNTNPNVGAVANPQPAQCNPQLFADVNGDGKDDYINLDVSGMIYVSLSNGSGFSLQQDWIGVYGAWAGRPFLAKMCDVNGDGKKDLLFGSISGSGTGKTITLNVLISTGSKFVPPSGSFPGSTKIGDFMSEFADPVSVVPDVYPNGTFRFLDRMQAGVAGRISTLDINGDGRDDILIHCLDGQLEVLYSLGNAFGAPQKFNVGAASLNGQEARDNSWDFFNPLQFKGFNVLNDFTVSAIPCDLNGDGRMDYAWIEDVNGYHTADFGLFGSQRKQTMYRRVLAVTSLPGGGFSPAVLVCNYGHTTNGGTDIFRAFNYFVSSGDINGDGLTDFVSVQPSDVFNAGTMYENKWSGQNEQAPRVYIQLSKGGASPAFEQILLTTNNPVQTAPESARVQLPDGTKVFPTFDKINMGEWLNDHYDSLGMINMSSQVPLLMWQSAQPDNVVLTDVNGDGKADYVWYNNVTVANPTTTAGWYVMYSTGRSFSAPKALPLGWTPTPQIGPGAMSLNLQNRIPLDLNGDGISDYTYGSSPQSAIPAIAGFHLSSGHPGTRLQSVTTGTGTLTKVAYRPITDSSIYTRGPEDDPSTVAVEGVTYPIRELQNATYVVSDLYKDNGQKLPVANDSERLDRYSYQYSGNHLDHSGRGSLGFHTFVTLDQQTNIFKYQFLTQSFPMTGLTLREQTYRYWSDATYDNFRLISSHDNTVVFDLVSNGGTGTFGSIYPFISQAVESRWEDASTYHTRFAKKTSNAQPEAIFANLKPSGAHIVITAQSTFDSQTAPQLTLPGITGSYRPSDTAANGISWVVGTLNTSASFSGLPTKISYGNLTKLFTDYGTSQGNGYTETVTNQYLAPVGPLSGRVDWTKTDVTGGGFTDSSPKVTYTYSVVNGVNTPLVATKTTTASEANLSTVISTPRDPAGRVTSTLISGTNLLSATQGPASYTMTSVDTNDYDNRFDLPGKTKNTYGNTTLATYDAYLGLTTSTTGLNGDLYTTKYDGLGRVVENVDVNKNLTTTTAYAWDSSQTVSGPSGFNGVASGANIVGVSGLTLTSSYSISTSSTVKPTVSAFYDRLGRRIRTIKNGFNAQTILSDTAYNSLSQTIAISLPYNSGSTVYWTKNTFDALGRLVSSTAPNNTVTSNVYNGRVTTATVTPAAGQGAVQTTSTLVNPKGKTVAVWNADNVATFSDTIGTTSASPSISFVLDGFGRMRATNLLNQTKNITAAYDALGQQSSLSDPDKGPWTYVNSALGQVLTQTDAKSNVTNSIYDQLGRPLSRVTTSLGASGDGSMETANFYYYDTAANAASNASWHLVDASNKGWIGAPEREDSTTTSAPGYAGVGAFNAWDTSNLHYYDNLGRPSIELALLDGQWFYTCTNYDAYSRVSNIQHFWRPPGHEAANDLPYVWQDFGYNYAYDGSGSSSKSYLISVTDSQGRVWWDQPSYDQMDRVVSVRKGYGTGSTGVGYTTTRTYAPTDGTLTAISTVAGSTQIQNLTFGYDGLGNLKSRIDVQHSSIAETLTYDVLNRLQTSKQGTINYTTDQSGNISNKPDVNGTPSGANYTYDLPQPHAVHTAFGYTMAYDANGNLTSRLKANDNSYVRWAGFDKPRWLTRTTGTGAGAVTVGSEFHYNAARSRVMQLEFDKTSSTDATQVPTHYVRKRLYGLGATLEVNYINNASVGASPNWSLSPIGGVRIYVPGPDGMIGAREFNSNQPVAQQEKDLVYHYDHLGSIQSISTAFASPPPAYTSNSNQSGNPGLFSEEAWGQRRNPFTWTGAPVSSSANASDVGGSTSLTPRGFTGHEMLDDLGLVHMNGRIYDPLLGRFLSADLVVQNPGSLQSYNRYSYVENNPLSLVDPSGWLAVSPSVVPIAPPVAPPPVVPPPVPIPEPIIIAAAAHATALTIEKVVDAVLEADKMGDAITRERETVERGKELEKSGFPISPDEFRRRQQNPNQPNPGEKSPHEERLDPAKIQAKDGDTVKPLTPPNKEEEAAKPAQEPKQDEPKQDDAKTESSDRASGDAPKLVDNPKHNPNSSSPQPSNTKELFSKSIVDKNGVRWAVDKNGVIHRFSKPSNGETHWNGSTGGKDPIKQQNIPNDVRKKLEEDLKKTKGS